MKSIRKISQFYHRGKNIPVSYTKKKTSSFKPITRLQRIQSKGFLYPFNSSNKYIFLANSDGSGFKRQTYFNYPSTIPLMEMIDQINMSCYKQWQKSREHYQQHPFERLDLMSNTSLAISSLLALVLLYLVLSGEILSFTTYLFFFFCFLATSLIICLFVYFSTIPPYDADACMVTSIQTKLTEINKQEIISSQNNPKFLWTCHKECLWIALQILDKEQSQVKESDERQEFD